MPWEIEPFDRYRKSHTITGPDEIVLSLDTDDVPTEEVYASAERMIATLNATSGRVKVSPNYPSISAAHDIAEPWIELWSGDEWGEVMGSLLSAIHTDYGIPEEELAVLCSVLWRNLDWQWHWARTEGLDYLSNQPDDLREVRRRCAEVRDYWLKGGNLGDWKDTIKHAKDTIDSLPDWVFGEAEENREEM